MNTFISKLKFNNLLNKEGLYLFVILTAILTGLAITDANMIYAGLLLSPLFIYLSLHKPFIFPFGLYVMLIPFDSVLAITANNATLTKFLAILTIMVLLLKGIFENRLSRPDNISITWIAFITYCALTYLWAIQPANVISRLPTVVGLLTLYIVTASYKIDKYDFDTLKYFIVTGGLFAAVYSIYTYSSMETMRATLEVGGRSTDNNDFAFGLIIPVAISIQLFMDNRRKFFKLLYVGILAVIIFSIVITGSRGAFLGVCAVIFTYFLNMKKRFKLLALLILVAIMISSFIPDMFIERWGSAVETGGAGRTTIWYVGWQTLSEYWAFGAGLSNFPNAYNEFAFYDLSKGWDRGAHNIYLELIVEFGIVGFLIMLVAMISHYNVLRSHINDYTNEAIMLKASFFGILMSSAFLGSFWQKSFWLLWIIIIIYKNKQRSGLKNWTTT